MYLYGPAIVVISGVLTLGVAVLILRGAGRIGLLQAPNHRSSHTRITPTGGGLGFVVGVTIAGALLAPADPWRILPILIAGLVIATLGFADDRAGLSAGVRLGVELALFLGLAGLLMLGDDSGRLAMALPLALLLAVAGTYWVNIFNFMDGIDGLAAGEAAFVSLAAAGLMVLGGMAPNLAFWWLLSLGAAAVGFLAVNFPPARIFMGDVGSLFVAFMIAVLATLTVQAGLLPLPVWLILVALFVSDATVTLLHRLLRGEKVWQAHRRHAYQVLSRRFGHHGPVTLLYAAVNLVFLLPMAVVALQHPEIAWVLTAIVFVLLAIAALAAGAGRPEEPAAN